MTTVKDIVSCVFDEERIKLVKGRYGLWLFLFYNIICIFGQADIIVSFFFLYSARKDGVGGRTMATYFMYFLSFVKLVVWVKFASRNKIHNELKTIFNNWKVELSWPSYKLWIILAYLLVYFDIIYFLHLLINRLFLLVRLFLQNQTNYKLNLLSHTMI